MVHLDALDGATRHGIIERFIRVLHNRDSSVTLDRHQPHDTVVERAGEKCGNHPRAERTCGGPEERVDGRAVSVLSRPSSETDAVSRNEHVLVRRGDVDVTRLDALVVFRM